VAKTRLQLQGELVKGGGKKVYRNTFDVFAKTWRNEGIRGIQRGLPPAVSFSSISFVDFRRNFVVCVPGAYYDPLSCPMTSLVTDSYERLSTRYCNLQFLPLYSFLMPSIPGFYEPIRRATNQLVGSDAKEQIPVTSVFAGAASGVVGGCAFDILYHVLELISSFKLFLETLCS
jgi:solute carrier family 25 protein 34/35